MFLLTIFLLFPTFLCEYSSKKSLIASNHALLEALKVLTASETQVGGSCEGLADKQDCTGDDLDCDNAYQRKIVCKKACCEAAAAKEEPEAPKVECNTPPNPKCELCNVFIDDCGGKKYKVTTYEATGSSMFGTCTYPKNVKTVSKCPPEFVSANKYLDQGSGKCQTIAGGDPKHKYIANKGSSSCRSECDDRADCYGVSVSSYGNCLLWLQKDIMGKGNEWGAATCVIKQKKPGFVGMDYCYIDDTVFKGKDAVACCTGESKKEEDGLCTEMLWDQMFATIDDDKKKAFSELDLSDVVQAENCRGRQGKEADCRAAATALGLGFYVKIDSKTGKEKPVRISSWPNGCVFSTKKKMLLYNSKTTLVEPSKEKTQICFLED